MQGWTIMFALLTMIGIFVSMPMFILFGFLFVLSLITRMIRALNDRS